jgi:hypothetical protein
MPNNEAVSDDGFFVFSPHPRHSFHGSSKTGLPEQSRPFAPAIRPTPFDNP